jgi:hypothetical protein
MPREKISIDDFNRVGYYPDTPTRRYHRTKNKNLQQLFETSPYVVGNRVDQSRPLEEIEKEEIRRPHYYGAFKRFLERSRREGYNTDHYYDQYRYPYRDPQSTNRFESDRRNHQPAWPRGNEGIDIYNEFMERIPTSVGEGRGIPLEPNVHRKDDLLYPFGRYEQRPSIFRNIKNGIIDFKDRIMGTGRYEQQKESQRAIDAMSFTDKADAFSGYGRRVDEHPGQSPGIDFTERPDKDYYTVGGTLRRWGRNIGDKFREVFRNPEPDDDYDENSLYRSNGELQEGSGGIGLTRPEEDYNRGGSVLDGIKQGVANLRESLTPSPETKRRIADLPRQFRADIGLEEESPLMR